MVVFTPPPDPPLPPPESRFSARLSPAQQNIYPTFRVPTIAGTHSPREARVVGLSSDLIPSLGGLYSSLAMKNNARAAITRSSVPPAWRYSGCIQPPLFVSYSIDCNDRVRRSYCSKYSLVPQRYM